MELYNTGPELHKIAESVHAPSNNSDNVSEATRIALREALKASLRGELCTILHLGSPSSVASHVPLTDNEYKEFAENIELFKINIAQHDAMGDNVHYVRLEW